MQAIELPVRTWWQASATGLPRTYWLLWCGTLLNRLGYMVQPFMVLYLSRVVGLSVVSAGVVVAFFGLGTLFSPLIGGYLADHIGRRFTLLVGMLASALAFLSIVLAARLIVLTTVTLLAGLAIDLYRPAMSALVADIVPSRDRARAFSLNYWAINVGVALSGVIGGVLAQHSFWLLFVIDAATCIGFAGLIVWRVPETKPQTADKRESTGYRVVLRDRLLVTLVGIALVASAIFLQTYVTLPLVLRQDNLSIAVYGLLTMTNAITVVVCQPVLMRWFTRWRQQVVIVAALLVLGVGFGLMIFVHSAIGYVATVVVWTLGEIGFNGVMPSVVANIAPEHARGRYSGAFALAFGASSFVAPLLGTTMLDWFGRNGLWGMCVVGAGIAACVMWSLGPALRGRLAVE